MVGCADGLARASVGGGAHFSAFIGGLLSLLLFGDFELFAAEVVVAVAVAGVDRVEESGGGGAGGVCTAGAVPADMDLAVTTGFTSTFRGVIAVLSSITMVSTPFAAPPPDPPPPPAPASIAAARALPPLPDPLPTIVICTSALITCSLG